MMGGRPCPGGSIIQTRDVSPSAATAASGAVCVLEADSGIGAWQRARQ
jgi:hypothetical protein